MAIPFYEDEPVAATAASLESSHITDGDGDQVDGPAFSSDVGYDQVDYEAPTSAATATSHSQATSTEDETAPSTEEQLLAWKMLALAMCKVLKQFYLQQQKGKSAKLTATVQIQPQAQ
ncbi:uncharacterized protein LOC117569154 [Drosophila albomicans]|uniref:Uncharacterized protein LOC117569154 n=1 Tax=Drosophila albomicans TaxID=7291 RepID=A0A6P8X4D4_DROAB|nr:uncharacterized protein LOC117569154 [Drosophila albomicans]